MPSACCAPGCTNRFLKGVIQMFRIPTSDAERFDRWVKKINRLPLKGQKSSRSDGLWEPNDTHRQSGHGVAPVYSQTVPPSKRPTVKTSHFWLKRPTDLVKTSHQ